MNTGAGSAVAARPGNRRARGGANPTSALHSLRVTPVPFRIAKALLVREHYLHSMPGGTTLAFGVTVGERLLGAVTLGAGPPQAYRLVTGASLDDCLVLTRLWLDDEMPKNSESRTLGFVARVMRQRTSVKFMIAYADPSQGHLGTVYQAAGWLYTGLSDAMPLYDLGDGVHRHSRSLAQVFGTHSVRHFQDRGVPIGVIPQTRKHRYVYFLDPAWPDRLHVPVLPYPQRENP